MKRIPTVVAAMLMTAVAAMGNVSEPTMQKLNGALRSEIPAHSEMGKVAVSGVEVNAKKKIVEVNCTAHTGNIPFTAESLARVKSEMQNALQGEYAGYKLVLKVDGRDADQLLPFASRKNAGPKEKNRFITYSDKFSKTPTKGLDGSNIAMWQSHGYYFEKKLNRWEWQRARIFQTVEDLYTQGYVMPFLMPMLENAGAYVMSPRERDVQTVEYIVDNDGGNAVGKYGESGSWSATEVPGFAYLYNVYGDDPAKSNPFNQGTARQARSESGATATWSAPVENDGTYAVYVSYQTTPKSTTEALYTVHAADGDHQVKVNQKMGGGTWIYLGHYQLAKGENPVVTLTANGKKGTVTTADAVKVGGGMGNIVRPVTLTNDNGQEQTTWIKSEYPRFTEGARYFLQWAGMPDSVYTPKQGTNDYTDDYTSRALWVNYMTGGSSMAPKRQGLNVPIDLSFAFHSDAGTTMNDSIIGTLGIYSTNDDLPTGNGSSRLASRDLTNLVVTQIVEDVRKGYEPDWTRRGMWDQKYYEARVPEVPCMLLELLSHQNFADMKYGLDPTFRFTVSRAIYKGMLRFLAERDGRPYVVQPLPVRSFAITGGADATYTLTWKETVDTLESTATPTYYNVEMRKNNGAFARVATVDTPSFSFTAPDDAIYSFRVVAGTDGGVSFPSEVLALCHKPGMRVNIVNGFTRISAPDSFDAGKIAGFYDAKDHGVPYISDISFIGSQFEYRRDIPWMDDDAAGFGASRADQEDKVIAGNTFDFVYTHGEAVRNAGYGFVSSSVEAYMNSTADEAEIVDLILGKQKEIKVGRGVYGTKYKTFPAELQQKITSHCNNGGSVFVSGAYVATDLWDNNLSDEATLKADQKFATEVLGYHWRVGQASITGEAYEVPTSFSAFAGKEFRFSNELNQWDYAVESPDSFYPADERGEVIMRYKENNLVAGTAMADKNYRTVVIGFPFETIRTADSRDILMKQVLGFLNKK